MPILILFLLLLALVLFVIAAVGVAAGRFNLIAAGLFCLTLALFLPALQAVAK